MIEDPIAGASLLVLHGFNSAGTTGKADVLRAAFPHLEVISPTYCHDPNAACHVIEAAARQALERDSRLAVLGTSLGGFYARWLAAKLGVPAVLINPAMDPAVTLREALGWNTNFKTGERYLFEQAQLQRLSDFYLPEDAPSRPALVLLDMNDELLDSNKTLAFFANRPATRVAAFPGGEHRFAHLDEAIPEIRTFLREQLTRNAGQKAIG